MTLSVGNLPVVSACPTKPSGSGKVLVCFSHLRWDFVYQRPQHLLSRAAGDRQVYFLEEPVFDTAGPFPRLETRTKADGVVVATPVLRAGASEAEIVEAQRVLLEALLLRHAGQRIEFWYYTPMALEFSRHLEAELCVYDCMDELSAFHGAPTGLPRLEQELFDRCDLVFTGGRNLYDAKRGRHPHVHCFPSSIDSAHFARARQPDGPEPADQRALRRPRIGFFGVIDERMDLPFVDDVARQRPGWDFVILGPVAKIDPESLPRRPNLHWLGHKSYQELPSYLAGWDAGFMPFALNDSTRFISPTKTPEFLAAGVPVVSTPIADVIRPYGDMGLVEIAGGADETVARLDLLLRRSRHDWLEQVDRFLSGFSWDATWAGMNRLMAEAETRAALSTTPPITPAIRGRRGMHV